MDAVAPGAPFWLGFTAFCTQEAALFVLDQTNALTIDRFWVATLGSLFTAGVVYGRAKVDELRRRNGVGSQPRHDGA